MTRVARAEFARTVAAGLAGAALMTVGANQGWATATSGLSAMAPVTASGSDVAPVAAPLGLVALACWGAVLVLRGKARVVVSALGLVSSLGVIFSVLAGFDQAAQRAVAQLPDGASATTTTSPWPWITLAAAVVSVWACGVAIRRSSSWPEMSRRYDAPRAAPVSPLAPSRPFDQAVASTAEPGAELLNTTEARDSSESRSGRDLWNALDEGSDPTA